MKIKIKDREIEVIADKGLMPKMVTLNKVVGEHPFYPNMYLHIRKIMIIDNTKIKIYCCFDCQTVEFHLCRNKTFRNLHLETYCHKYNSMLWHEFGHVADKVNPKFEYSDKKRDELYEAGAIYDFVETLWNVYIDTRLHEKRLLKINKCNIPKKLGEHLNDLINKGFKDDTEGRRLIDKIWDNPTQQLTYEDLISYANVEGR